ncbi:MAG TPA: short chain dehydrogenase [Cryomorphaceae bacterium]|nr:short chain dehydrogenase [Cryomorphaceae bacterium]
MMKKVTVVGGTGTIGSAVKNLLQTEGYHVTGASRHSEDRIDIEDSESIRTFFTKTNQIDALICAAGDASFGAFSELTDEQFRIGLNSKLMGQVSLVRAGLPKLNPNGVIVLTGGIFAHQPWPKTSSIAMVNAAIEGFVKALALEMTEDRRILVVHPPFVKETAEAMQMDGSKCPQASDVAKAYLQCLETEETGVAIYLKEPDLV